ncbi:DpnD/PcfM family protein [Psychrobacter faecalis]|uniref:DpnD/PcfM family protein n=1 Tax=Psychrobacter faecalis TaxID=180588 RepID=UPI003FD5ECB8
MIKSDKTVEEIFQIEIVETLSNLVKISAEDEQGALLKAQELYRNEDVVLYPDNLIDTKFNIFKYG